MAEGNTNPMYQSDIFVDFSTHLLSLLYVVYERRINGELTRFGE